MWWVWGSVFDPEHSALIQLHSESEREKIASSEPVQI